MNTEEYFKSLTLEIKGLQNRVRNFIQDRHWATDGEWKESTLRYLLRRNLPSTVEVGRGFVITPTRASSQIDVLIYKSSVPVLFREGDLVFVTPDSVVAVIEVKSRLNAAQFATAVSKLSDTAQLIGLPGRLGKLFGLFAFESTVKTAPALRNLAKVCLGNVNRVTDLVCLGDSHLICFWTLSPENRGKQINRWHSYKLAGKAPGYFIHYVVSHVSPDSVRQNQEAWFGGGNTEQYKDGESGLSAPPSR